jgi:hypothetical protein
MFHPVWLAAPEQVAPTVQAFNTDERIRAIALERNLQPRISLPNFFSAAQDNCIGGSPGSFPRRLQPEHRRLLYVPTIPDFVPEQARDANRDVVRVAVLDTGPPANEVVNAQLQQLQPRLQMDTFASRAQREVVLGSGVLPGATPAEAPPFDKREHGLFVSGLIDSVAPWVSIRLLRVLNDQGVGTLQALLLALQDLLAENADGAPLIVNLSLGALPPVEQLRAVLASNGVVPAGSDAAAQEIDMTAWKDVASPERDVFFALRDLVELLQRRNCLIVAAAGNDSGRGYKWRWNPRAPACYDNVLAVAATGRSNRAASYSNIGDVPVLGNGFATFGGNAAGFQAVADDAVAGLYTARAFPPGADSPVGSGKEAGWALWAGTSFATPLMSGTVANYWASQWDPDKRTPQAADVLAQVNDIIRHNGVFVPELDAPEAPVAARWFD